MVLLKQLNYYLPSARHGEAIAYAPRELDVERLQEGIFVNHWDTPRFEVGGFDQTTGTRIQSGKLTDFLQNDCGWLIVGRSVMEALIAAGVGSDRVQWLDLHLEYGERELRGAYFVANILDLRSAVHTEKSRYIEPNRTLTKIVLSRPAVEGAELFRLKEWRRRIYFSHRLKQMIHASRFTGVEWGLTEVSS